MVQVLEPMLDQQARKKLIGRARRTRDQYLSDSAMLKTRHEKWRGRYANNWIAIYSGEVYGPASSRDELMATLHEAGVPQRRAIVHFFSETRKLRIL